MGMRRKLRKSAALLAVTGLAAAGLVLPSAASAVNEGPTCTFEKGTTTCVTVHGSKGDTSEHQGSEGSQGSRRTHPRSARSREASTPASEPDLRARRGVPSPCSRDVTAASRETASALQRARFFGSRICAGMGRTRGVYCQDEPMRWPTPSKPPASRSGLHSRIPPRGGSRGDALCLPLSRPTPTARRLRGLRSAHQTGPLPQCVAPLGC